MAWGRGELHSLSWRCEPGTQGYWRLWYRMQTAKFKFRLFYRATECSCSVGFFLCIEFYFSLVEKLDYCHNLFCQTITLIVQEINCLKLTEKFNFIITFEFFTQVLIGITRYVYRFTYLYAATALGRAGRSGDRIQVRERFSAPVQSGPGDQPASCPTRTRCFCRE